MIIYDGKRFGYPEGLPKGHHQWEFDPRWRGRGFAGQFTIDCEHHENYSDNKSEVNGYLTLEFSDDELEVALREIMRWKKGRELLLHVMKDIKKPCRDCGTVFYAADVTEQWCDDCSRTRSYEMAKRMAERRSALWQKLEEKDE